MKRLDFLPISGQFEVIKFEEFNPIDGQISMQFEKNLIIFEKSIIKTSSFENTQKESITQEIREIFLQEETEQKKMYLLIATDDSVMLLITAGRMTLSEINKPFLMIFSDLMMTTGYLLSLNRIH